MLSILIVDDRLFWCKRYDVYFYTCESNCLVIGNQTFHFFPFNIFCFKSVNCEGALLVSLGTSRSLVCVCVCVCVVCVRVCGWMCVCVCVCG